MQNKDWTDFLKTAYVNEGGSLDEFLKEAEDESIHTSVRRLVEQQKVANLLELPVPAGTRVHFERTAGYLSEDESSPPTGVLGTVVTVRARTGGDLTDNLGRVFVSWDDGVFRPIFADNLRLVEEEDPVQCKKATEGFARRAFDLTGFMKVAEDTLVQKATKDLWNCRKDGESYVIERLFDEGGDPLKV